MAQSPINIFQQYQLMLLQSLLSGKVSMGFNPGMFGIPSLHNSSASPTQVSTPTPLPPLSFEHLNTSALTSISSFLSASSNINNRFAPSPSTSPESSAKATAYGREYKVHVNRESAKPLQDWMDQNIHNPYPSMRDVKQLSQATGFTHKQIRNWFTNSRRRYEQKARNSPLPWIKKDAPKVITRFHEFSLINSPKVEDQSEAESF